MAACSYFLACTADALRVISTRPCLPVSSIWQYCHPPNERRQLQKLWAFACRAVTATPYATLAQLRGRWFGSGAAVLWTHNQRPTVTGLSCDYAGTCGSTVYPLCCAFTAVLLNSAAILVRCQVQQALNCEPHLLEIAITLPAPS